MKKILKNILTISLMLIMAIMICSCDQITIGGNNNKDDDAPWDQMGGGGTGEDTPESDLKSDDIEKPDDLDDDKLKEDTEDAILIDLSNLEAETTYYTYKKDTLTITTEGTYELTGSLNGALVIDGDAKDTRIILNGVSIITTDTQDTAAITFKKNSSLRVLTIKEGTTNTLKDSVGDTVDGEGAIIVAKKSSLTINGKGTLKLIAIGEDTTAIKVKNNLEIINTNIEINATNNGIKADKQINIYDANITVEAGNDGIKTDVEATTTEEIEEFTSDPYAGAIYIKNSNLTLNTKDDGISANSMLYIENNDKNLIKITTNNGAPTKVTESSKEKTDGKAIKVAGIVSVINDVETDLPSKCENNYMLVITGGKFEINSNDDALHSKGNLLISDGIFDIATGDDGIHAEYITKIEKGQINITKSYEGIEGASVEIYGGTINVTSTDDGINAANSDLKNWDYNIYIGGGEILINAEGDGVDSNGTIEIIGGKTIIFGPTKNDNGSLDADKGILVNGGILLAFGSSGMVETPSSNSTQASIVYNATRSFAANTTFKLTAETGNVLYEVTPTKTYQSVVISTPELVKNQKFTLTAGTTTESITITAILNKIGQSFGPGGMGPGGPGHRPF